MAEICHPVLSRQPQLAFCKCLHFCDVLLIVCSLEIILLVPDFCYRKLHVKGNGRDNRTMQRWKKGSCSKCWYIRTAQKILKASGPLPLDVPNLSVMQSDTVSPRYQLSATAGCRGMRSSPKHRVNVPPAFGVSGFKEKAFP